MRWPPGDCCVTAMPIPSMPGSTATPPRDWSACWPINREGTTVAGLDRRDELQQRLRQGPASPPSSLPTAADAAPAASTAPPEGVVPMPWTLETIRTSFDWLKDYSRSGVWRLLQRYDLRLRSAAVQQFSPDPDYAAKCVALEMALWEARRYPRSVVAVFLDQMGFTRWPDPGPDWGAERPVADRRGAKQGLWRLMGALNPFTGQVD